MLYLVVALAALTLGYAAGYMHYRTKLLHALRAGAVRHPAHTFDTPDELVEPPIDHDAMFRIIRQHQR